MGLGLQIYFIVFHLQSSMISVHAHAAIQVQKAA